MKIRNILSLFNGMSCGQIALDRAGIEYDNYYSSEIDKWAIKVNMENYPDTIQLGDIENWREWNIDWSTIDLLIGGSPCQGFSFAGKQLAFDDPRSRLFFVFVDILRHVQKFNPDVKFMLENVRMKKEWADVISQQLGVWPKLINSALVSAQNRNRMYWANWEFDPPEDKGIKMIHILEDGWSTRDKSYCLDANYGKGTNFRRYFFRGSRQLVLNGGYHPSRRMTKENANKIMHEDGNQWRKLTPLECERLQTVPCGYTSCAPDFERYKMLGNGWTADVIAHIFRALA